MTPRLLQFEGQWFRADLIVSCLLTSEAAFDPQFWALEIDTVGQAYRIGCTREAGEAFLAAWRATVEGVDEPESDGSIDQTSDFVQDVRFLCDAARKALAARTVPGLVDELPVLSRCLQIVERRLDGALPADTPADPDEPEMGPLCACGHHVLNHAHRTSGCLIGGCGCSRSPRERRPVAGASTP